MLLASIEPLITQTVMPQGRIRVDSVLITDNLHNTIIYDRSEPLHCFENSLIARHKLSTFIYRLWSRVSSSASTVFAIVLLNLQLGPNGCGVIYYKVLTVEPRAVVIYNIPYLN